MDHIQSQLDKLSELDDAQIVELRDTIISEFETVSTGDVTPQSVDAMTTLADMHDAVGEEVARREVQAAELATRAAEASARVKGDEPSEETSTDVDPEVAEEAPVEAPAEEVEEPIAASAAEEEVSTPEETVTETTEPETEPVVEEPETEAPAEAEPVVEEPVVEEASTETPVEAEASAEDTVVEAPTEAASELASEEAPTEETTPEAELSVEEAEVEAPVEAEASTEEETTHTENEPEAQEEAPVTAAASESFEAPADRRPNLQEKVSAPVAITAGADIPGLTAGSKIDSMSEVSEAMAKRVHSLRRVNGGDGEQHIVASLTTQYPEARVLGTDREENSKKIEDVTGPQAIMASGGFSAPLEASYDIFGFGTDVRPVKNSLPVFQADRGGVRYLTPPVLSSYANAVGVWTNAMDIDAADNDGTATDLRKNVLTVGSAQENTAYTDAITLQLQFGNLLTRAFPELIARHNELALIQHARIAEINLLSKINAASTKVTTTGTIGFARDFLVNIKRAAAAYRSRHRIDPGTQLRAIVPTWVYDAMSADLTLNMPGDDNLGNTRGDLNSYLALSNVTLTASLDQNTFGAQNAGALLEFPDEFTWFLFSEGSFVFLDGGTLDIGIIRDSGLVGTNDYRMFTETFEGLAFVGIESLAITSAIAVNGTAAALATPVEY
jgi:chemotaxis protein histidine kinase CheA